MKNQPLQIGASIPRQDAYSKVTGQEKFAADYYGENLVWAGVKRAGIAHGILRKIDCEKALHVPGVVCVLTHEHVSGTNRQGVVRKDQPVLVNDKVRHCGDAVALVLADSEEALKNSLALIQCTFDELPGVFDPEEAMKSGAPLIHDDIAQNVLLHGEIKTGSGVDAEKECDIILEACFATPHQEHAYLETEVGWACVEADGKLKIVCSTQTPFRDRMEVAEALGLEFSGIRIVAPYAGGAFGGKDGVTVQTLLGLAALNAGGRPVKMHWNREESFISGTKRHSARMYYRLGAKADGTLHCLSVRLYYDTGPYDHLGGVVLTLGLEHSGGAYRIPHVYLRGWAVYTNNPIGGAFRGFGVPQVNAAMEQMMDTLAAKLNVDPLALRIKNALRRGDKTSVGKTLVCSTGLIDCLQTVSGHPLWKNRNAWKSEAPHFKRRGIGIAAVMQGSGYGPVVPDYANAKVELTVEGTFRVYCGVVDMGQGNASTNAQIAGSILGQNATSIEPVLPDTDRTLPSGSASASRCTYTFGNALIGAAEALRKRILQRAADLLMIPGIEEMVLVNGAVKHLTTGREIKLSQIAQFLNDSERISVHHFRAPVAQEDLGIAANLRLHGMPHTLFSFGAHLAAVEIDELTGILRIERYMCASDCGKVINPQIYAQQIHGGVGQGIGYAISEELNLKNGTILNPDLSTYLIPTTEDIPDIESHAVELYEPTGPFGLKGVGEVAVNGPLPAIANAVADACGVRIHESPLTAERILKALHSKNRENTE
ncbi:xanthine dehydrogenase family protein molybdopterin-binding subunit [Desulfomonile tiedjei]|uniref:Aerobic-type carbon monoxide dehydrogenase, large subunit CoxL/CutL-like protein n=1 Tax=Desulfomonile tiedjei (strain ATCC 49306 / DSM 6799 / DCB-1) TaxID=706587 RepID=I4CCY9_DESTA|nr:xanthine dehydrogenase family protein molybdopterin-binding subunit [Desulfomonile tiedjei]AFM27430.1 aerobic-type carbon monoxide dehydrogenase, large subunit CoxL/CutL-like protein [Desulfomonile tiedjei DSM 6799]